MTSKEALKELKAYAISKWGIERLKIIEKDLDRLEKLEKVIELLWRKNVNIVYIKIFKDFKKYSEYYTGYSSKDKLTNEDFDLLKEVLRDGI